MTKLDVLIHIKDLLTLNTSNIITLHNNKLFIGNSDAYYVTDSHTVIEVTKFDELRNLFRINITSFMDDEQKKVITITEYNNGLMFLK